MPLLLPNSLKTLMRLANDANSDFYIYFHILKENTGR